MMHNTQLGNGNVAVQVVGDGNSIVVGQAHLLLTRFENARLGDRPIAAENSIEVLHARSRSIHTVGRDTLLAEYWDWLTDGRAVSIRVLTGPAGRGKTRRGCARLGGRLCAR